MLCFGPERVVQDERLVPASVCVLCGLSEAV